MARKAPYGFVSGHQHFLFIYISILVLALLTELKLLWRENRILSRVKKAAFAFPHDVIQIRILHIQF